MHLLQQLILDHLPTKKKVTTKGWIWMNAPCCVHRGHKPDTRQRGNIWFGADQSVGYHCFNCGCKWRFNNTNLSEQLQNWLIWLGVDTTHIQKLKLKLLSDHVQGVTPDPTQSFQGHVHRFKPVPLPAQAEPMHVWAQHDPVPEKFMQACAYVHARALPEWEHYDYYWSPLTEHDMCDRIILPFYNQNVIVGWSARLCTPPRDRQPKYWNSDVPPGYLFNQDQLLKPRKYVIVCEGPLDAIACQGVAAMGSALSEPQIKTLLDHGQQPVVLPDRQRTNQHMIDQALAFGWAISFPDWDAHIKDAADACKAYGQVYTITSALQAITTNPISIGIKRQMFQG